MKKIIIAFVVVAMFMTAKAQTLSPVKDTTAKVEIALGRIVNGTAVILANDRGRNMKFTTFDSLTTLIAFYKTAAGEIAIDSICYDVTFYKNTEIVRKSFCGFTFATDYIKDILLSRESVSFYVKVNRIVLKDGRTILNPKVENERSIKSKDAMIMQGVLFSVE
ncbi:MAG: hypothetical protein WCM76_12230 [Bacteroidota bacterium]